MYKAKLNNFRVSPRKGRLVADLIRGKKVERAQAILKFTLKKTSEPMLKLLNSAAANAKNIDGVEVKDLYISRVVVNAGAIYKRIMPRARGTANRINKRTSHFEIELDKIVKKVKDEDKKIKTKKNEPQSTPKSI
ncbi:MAG: 50S ribosomal protein L22 [Candidatus Pacebacteria bacterium]|nr:50S ribosomal protein L22 [Candidatus Paceibacterota bacterium]